MNRRLGFLALLAALCVPLAVSAQNATTGDRLLNPGQEGQSFDYMPSLVHGKINVIDFYSQFCPPCRAIMPRLEKLAQVDGNVVVGRVDINRPGHRGIDWSSPVARQYALRSIPSFKVYDVDGKLVAEGKQGSEYVYRMLQKKGL